MSTITLLKGAHVLVTRPVHQAAKLSVLINQCGGVAVSFPTLEIVEQDDKSNIVEKLACLDKFQWLVFISANAVNFAVKANGGKIDAFAMSRIVAIGPATAKALRACGLVVDLMPPEPYTTETLLMMQDMHSVLGQKLLIVRGEKGREDLADTLRSRGASVNYLNVYKRVVPSIDNRQVLALLAEKRLNIMTATSVDALKNLLIMLGDGVQQQLFTIPLVVVSERIKGIAVDMGFERVAVTEHPSDAAILKTVTTCVTGG